MKVVETIDEMRQLRQRLAEPVGFVPTMGYLHEGHLSLVRQARAENQSLVVSIFVNPTQFGPQEDFRQYPRNPQRDLALLEKDKTDIVFMPSAAEMYPPQFSSWVEVGKVTERLVFSSGLPDPDGLAISSRNTYLNPEERQAATVVYQALCLAQKLWSQGETDAQTIRQQMIALIQKEPLATIDYVSVANAATLEELDKVSPSALVSLAVRIGKTRLIDNVVLG